MPAAQAAYLGNPAPQVREAYAFRHGLDVDRSVRKLSTSRWNSPVTMRNLRFTARESYGVAAWRDVLVEASGIFGVSRADIDFGTVDLGDVVGAAFWDKFAPDVPHTGGRRQLTFGDHYGPTVGAALRGRLIEWRGAAVSVGGQLLYTSNSDTGQPAMVLRYNEWDLFAGLSWTGRFMSLYTGWDNSWLVGELTTPDPNIATDLDQETGTGVFAGIALHFYRHWDVATELRLINQSAVSVQVLYEY
ncbi:MAG: hypothetical protein HZA24_01280 [Nitrospirae bacterium]|nr:hypothetical protein [Nitrospirota bacterium]